MECSDVIDMSIKSRRRVLEL